MWRIKVKAFGTPVSHPNWRRAKPISFTHLGQLSESYKREGEADNFELYGPVTGLLVGLVASS